MTCGSVLSIDTAGDTCSVAVQKTDGAVVEAYSAGSGDHFEKIALLVEQSMRDSGVLISELASIRVGLGPGSFTGLRIGVSFCKGLAWAYGIPLIGVCSFEALAHVALRKGISGKIAVASDARREEVFCAAYDLDPLVGGVATLGRPHIASVSDFVAEYMNGLGTVPVFSPMRSFEMAGKSLESIERPAFGGLYASVAAGPFCGVTLGDLEPNYLRAVAAKTIEERRLGA
jgi:tRNA threonylcarbamoyl adenosine modification protein YeaZ